MLNHIVHNEKSKLQTLLLLALIASWDHLIAKSLNEWVNELLVGLEEDAH